MEFQVEKIKNAMIKLYRVMSHGSIRGVDFEFHSLISHIILLHRNKESQVNKNIAFKF